MTPKAHLIFMNKGKEVHHIDIYALREAEDNKKFEYDVIYKKVFKKETTYEIASLCAPGKNEPKIKKLKQWDQMKIADPARKKEIDINERSNVKVLNNRLKLLPFSERTLQKLNQSTKKSNSISQQAILVSTSNLGNLPDRKSLNNMLRALAVFDIILKPMSNRIYFYKNSYLNSHQVGSMQHHNGDHFYVVFTEEEVIIKGFMVDCPMNPDYTPYGEIYEGVLSELPEKLLNIIEDEYFESEYSTFCIWKANEDKKWKIGNISFPSDHNDPDGSKFVLEILSTNHSSYTYKLRREFGRLISFDLVKHIFSGEPITEEIIKELNPDVNIKRVLEELKETGYKIA